RGIEDRAKALASVASRLAHAMRESHGPVERMAAALERTMRALARQARALERLRVEPRADAGGGSTAATPPLEELEHCREALEHEIAICIESLQFHDSLMQQLSQVRAGLAAASGSVPHSATEMRLPDSAAGSIELF
ncbi:MAG TPA: hypothetical protein VGI35_11750, partial [Steroidobacteraceae bacterium]